MNFYELKDDRLIDPPDIRTEDGIKQDSRLREGIIIPCGFVLVLLFFVLAGLLINYLNSRYP